MHQITDFLQLFPKHQLEKNWSPQTAIYSYFTVCSVFILIQSKKKRHSFSVLHVDTFEFLAFPYIKTWECVCRSKYHFIKLKYWKYPNKTFARNSGQLSYLHIHMICSYTIWAIVSYTTFFFLRGQLFVFTRFRSSKQIKRLEVYIWIYINDMHQRVTEP